MSNDQGLIMFHITNAICVLISLLIHFGISWDLSNYNISSNYYVSSVAAFGTRAFLALPRSSCYNNATNPTLVEVSWFNEQQNLFPRKKPFFLDSQAWNNCHHLQDAISLDLEPMRPRLWVLDKGNVNCPAKVAIYNLFQKINYTLEAPEDIPKDRLNYLIVDGDVKTNGARAYVGLDGENYLLVFSLNEFKWWRVNLHSANNNLAISTKFLAFSRKEAILYVTGGEERNIFSLDLSKIRKDFTENGEDCNVTFLGEKLGASSALVADLKYGLNYYLIRDYVVIRWDTRHPSQAEYYSILAQSYEQLPYVSQLYTGPQNGIWALVNFNKPNECSEETPMVLKRRLVKILKYNVLT